jgi:DNA-binding NtrC family response regulator
MQKLLLVEDDPNLQLTIQTALEAQGYTVDAASTTGEAIERLAENSYPVVLTDIYIDERTGLDVLDAAKRKDPRCAVILMTGRGSVETVMAATKGGAFEYIAKPFELDTLFDALNRAESARNDTEAEAEEEELPESVMIGSSAAIVEIYKKVVRVAPTDATVVIEGETGTGKELAARMIHGLSLRAKQVFVPVDCAAIAPSLLESELFGAMRGAFTGADRDRVGVFEAANRGTVFLDEIGEIDKSFQANLLRFLQEREIRPLGASRAKEVDVRVICATNRDLQRLVDEGKFREDLWYRLNTVRLVMPPLRERRDDIPNLLRHFLALYQEQYQRPARALSGEALERLCTWPWPGNVRALRHACERAVILGVQPEYQFADFGLSAPTVASAAHETAAPEPQLALGVLERDAIAVALDKAKGNISHAARLLGVSRAALYRKLGKHGI